MCRFAHERIVSNDHAVEYKDWPFPIPVYTKHNIDYQNIKMWTLSGKRRACQAIFGGFGGFAKMLAYNSLSGNLGTDAQQLTGLP